MHILIIKLGAQGDVVRTTSLIPGLKKLYPLMQLTWVTAKNALPLVSHLPDIQNVYAIDDFHPTLYEHTLFDWVISLDDEQEACALASRLKYKKLSGAYEDSDKRVYTSDLAAWFGMGVLRSQENGGLQFANQLKKQNQRSFGEILYECLGLPMPIARPQITIGHLPHMVNTDPNRLIIGLNTSAGARWKYKSWGEEQTVQLAKRLHDELYANVLILGGSQEATRNQRIVAQAARPYVLETPSNMDLLSFAALIAKCDLLVSSDSLAMHFGIALEKPVIVFFGPTSSAEIDLFGLGEKVVTPLPCRCCYLKGCSVRYHCMESIPVERLLNAVVHWLPAIRKAA
ncbi:MAG: glycosyltransferase family 9 protein [Bdellovibrio sp.]|nr:glycosyltransferase family 9 protein [Bdellovibrio sp.]